MTLPKYSMGIGDRFAHQGVAQLQAFIAVQKKGISIAPVWNKSNREHMIIHTEPSSVRAEADAATAQVGWKSPYFVDADHIGLKTVDRFLEPSDFFTLDVADFTGKPANDAEIDAFVKSCKPITGALDIPHLASRLVMTEADVRIADN